MIRSYKGVIFQLKNTTKNGVKCLEASIDVSFNKSRYIQYARLDLEPKPYAPDLFIALLDRAISDVEKETQGVCIVARLLRSIKQDLIEYANPY